MNRNIVILLSFSVLLSCSRDKPAPVIERNNLYFSLSLPSDWILVNQQGEDTYVGYYESRNDKINFDCGYLAFNTIDDEKQNSTTLYYEEFKIDSADAKIIKEKKTTEGTILSIYIDKRDGIHKARLYVLNSNNDSRFISIFKSFKFN